MQAHGVYRKDRGCCPGHDKYPSMHYHTTSTGAKKRRQKHRKSRARMASRALVRSLLPLT